MTRASPWRWRIGDRVEMRVDVGRAGGRRDRRPGLVVDVGAWGVVVAFDNAPAPDMTRPAYVDPAFLFPEGGAP